MVGKFMEPKLKIEYPCLWGYTVVGQDEQGMRKILETVLLRHKYTLNCSKMSSNGKYCSIRVSVKVGSEEERLYLYNELSSHSCIKVVL